MTIFEDTIGKAHYILLGTVPTKILTFGIEFQPSKRLQTPFGLILMISGNPGEIEYYRNFLSSLYTSTTLPVVGISNSGHNRLPSSLSLPPIYANSSLYDLEAQIKHKAEFIEEYVDKGLDKLYLIGHSIGGYMCLELMDRYKNIEKMVERSFLIMPSLDRMAETEMGKRVNSLFRNYSRFLVGLATVLDLVLPHRLKRYAVSYVLKRDSKLFQLDRTRTLPECVIESGTNLLNPNCLRALILMTLSEFENVKTPNVQAMETFCDKLTMLYGENDHWAPIEYFYDLKNSLSEKVDARLCLEQIDHAFVIDRRGTEFICNIVANMIIKHKSLTMYEN